MQRICVFGPRVVYDEVEGVKHIITRAETWANFLLDVPRVGPCRHFVGHPSESGDSKRINGKHLKGYTFVEACKRVELELAPKTG
ncbi:MAG: hypothetical protein WAV25_01720 [Minisyncoccia bacterium]